MYAISPAGSELWNFPTGNAVWSAAAIDDVGRIFFGSVDSFLYGIDPAGAPLWSKFTIGFNAASASLGSDGTVYIGSFDGNLYALDPATGAERWAFETSDHIYAVGGAARRTRPVRPTRDLRRLRRRLGLQARPAGNLIWRYDTGDAIRSSPVLGRPPKGEPGGSSTSAPPTAGSMRSTPPTARAAGPTTRRRGAGRFATATT